MKLDLIEDAMKATEEYDAGCFPCVCGFFLGSIGFDFSWMLDTHAAKITEKQTPLSRIPIVLQLSTFCESRLSH